VNGKANGQQSPTPATESQLHQRSNNTAYSTTRTLLSSPIPSDLSAAEQGPASPNSEEFRRSIQERGNVVLNREDEAYLLPGFLPPKYHLLDLFPFSLIVRCLTKDGKGLSGRKAARLRAKLQSVSHNIPLEISLYLVSPNFLDLRTISDSVELLCRCIAEPKNFGCPHSQLVLLKLLF
jgi:putative membrane protein